MHLGSALIRGSRPLEAAGLIERNPKTRFLLMHLAWPWTDELLGMAFVYRNIWIDLTWSWLLGPSRFIGSLRQAIDVLPDESRMMLGGDTWHVEEAYGAIRSARRLVGESLEQCVQAGQFRAADAERLARKIFHDNAAGFSGFERRRGEPGVNRRKVTAYFIASTLYWAGLYIYVPTLPAFVKMRVSTLTEVGVVISMYGLWSAILRIPTGIIVDATGRRKATVVVGFLLAVVGALVMGTGGSAGVLMFGRALTGASTATWVPVMVIFAGFFRPEKVVFATSLLAISSSLGQVVATGSTAS